jgi:hypothetical protein
MKEREKKYQSLSLMNFVTEVLKGASIGALESLTALLILTNVFSNISVFRSF